MATKANKPDPRRALVEQMKVKVDAICGLAVTNCESVQDDFRDVIQLVLEVWDAKTPLLFFVWPDGAHAFDLGPMNANTERVHRDRRAASVWAEAASGGMAFEATLKSGLSELPLSEVVETVRFYYENKEPLASAGC